MRIALSLALVALLPAASIAADRSKTPPPATHQHIAAAPVSTPRTSDATVAVAGRKGMTWGVGAAMSRDKNITYVSCHGAPRTESGSCDAYQGDTSCTNELPLLCLSVDGRARPSDLVTPQHSGGVMPAAFYYGWAEGRIALSDPVRGSDLSQRADADAICAEHFGSGWRVAEHHDGGGGWGFIASGSVPATSRFWVAINDQPANCWAQ